MTSPLGDPRVGSLIRMALEEDHALEDITSRALVPQDARARGRVIARAPGRIAGAFLLEAASPLRLAFPDLAVMEMAAEGAAVRPGDLVARIEGGARSLLGLERTLLNFLQRLSGIATLTARFVEAVRGTPARILDTRKTCPGWRTLDKWAVAAGGGTNHRFHLADQVLVKENHLIFLEDGGTRSEAVARAVRAARDRTPEGTLLCIEVESLEEFRAALAEKPDVIMLDQMSDAETAAALELRDEQGQHPLIEVSGGVTLERVEGLARLGVDRISVGALTHSAPALDLAMEIEPLRNET